MKKWKDILARVEELPHDERVRTLVALGRKAADNPWIRDALAEGERGSCYERALALRACFGSREPGPIRRGLADPSAVVRALAIPLAVRFLDDEALAEALHAAPSLDRKTLMTALIRRERQGPIDRFADRLAKEGDRRLAEVLPRASSAVVERHQARWTPLAGAVHWKALGRFHARIATEAVYAALGQDFATVAASYGLYRGVLEGLLPRHPDLALALIEFARSCELVAPLPVLQRLFRLRPQPTVAPFLAHPAAGGLDFRAIARLDAAHLKRILKERPELVTRDLRWFVKLAAPLRDEVYLRHRCVFTDAQGRLPQELVARLSAAHREREARTHLGLPALAADRAARIQWAAYLPWEEGFALLDPFLSHADAALRQAALRSLVRLTAYHGAFVPRMLAVLAARGNEQDPVRQEGLRALVAFPPGRVGPEHLEPLERVVRAALEATDLTWVTAGLLQHVVARLLPAHPAWAARQLAVTVAARGMLGVPDLDRILGDGHVRRLAPHLAPLVATWEHREREYFLVILGQRLGRRIRAFPELLELLGRVASGSRVEHHAQLAGSLLWRWTPQRWHALVPRMLRADPSCLALPCVADFANRRRQDLLEPHLGTRKMPRGRFATGRTSWVLPVHDGFWRWTAAQQRTFAATLSRVAGEPDRDGPALAGMIRRLARIPEADASVVERLARSENGFTRRAAIAALAHLDADAGRPELARCLQDDRAHLAIYASLRLLRRMPPASALAFLRAVPLVRVTVAKEVLRLAGALGTDEALEVVLAAEASQRHKDVRAAILRALWAFLDRSRVWDVLERVALEEPPEVAFHLARIPLDGLGAGALARLDGLLAALLERGSAADRVPVLVGLRDRPVFAVPSALAGRLEALAGGGIEAERVVAAQVLAKFARPGEPAASALRNLTERVLDSPERLDSLARAVCWAVPLRLRHLGAAVSPVVERLGAAPERVHLAARLTLFSLPADEVAQLFGAWADAGRFGSHVVLAIHDVAREWALARPPAELAAIEAALAASPHPSLRQVALSLLLAQADRAGNYDAARRARLLAFRDDPAVEVSARAAFVLLPAPPSRLPPESPGPCPPTQDRPSN